MKIQRISFYEVILILSLFLFSLEDHGDVRLYVAVALVGMSIFFKGKIKVYKSIVNGFLLFVIFILIVSVLSEIDFASYRDNMMGYDEVNFFFSTSLKFLLCFIFLNQTFNEKEILLKVVSCVLSLHLAVFYIQFFTVYLTQGIYIDLLEPFTGEYARYSWNVNVPFIGQTFRPTGMYNEPSTYSAYMLGLFLILSSLTNNLGKIGYLTILSFFLSLSFASILCAFLILLVININKKGLALYFPIILVFSVILSPLFINMLEARMSGDYDAIGIRTGFFGIILNQTIEEIIFGNGPIGVPYEIEHIVNSSAQSWAKNGLPALNDNGLIIFILMKFGLLGCVLLFSFLFLCISDTRKLLLNIILLLTKIKYTSVVFIFYMAFHCINKMKSIKTQG
ncbi:hypothetical protein N5J40_08295 [Aeromonas caviae]|uniref:hypothetical protein n=1 Tax=Aeromonas TaxID=642 RepID=UPI00244CCCB8|nr:hypothetical protein [Aeromonas caviae]MDH1994806.1 hypothetical protein [Aeromonas caviae]